MKKLGLAKYLAGVIVLCLLLAACGTGGAIPATTQEATNAVDQPVVTATTSSQLQELTVRIGRQPPAGMSAVVSKYMMENKTFEEYARRVGYDLTVVWQNFPSAQPQIDAMIADRLEMGIFGATPVIRSIARGIGILPISIALGHENQYFTMRLDGPVHKPEDLRGKRVGLILGGEQQVFLSNVLKATFGEADPAKLDIELISLENQGQTCSVPQGTDVTLCINSVGLPKIMAGEITWAFDMFGNTGPAYIGPEGEGEGYKVAAVENSPYQPEGFFLARAWWVATSKFIDEHPRLVQAFVEAQQAAVNELKKGTAGEATQLIFEDIQLAPEVAGPMLENDLLWIRGWVWPTEGDYWGMVANSVLLAEVGAIDDPISWEQVLSAVKDIEPILQAAYQASGAYPGDDKFLDRESGILGGLPLWRSSEWTKPPAPNQ